MILNHLVSFPLQKHNGVPNLDLIASQSEALIKVSELIDSGFYKLEANPCQCSTNDSETITEQDCYGLPFKLKLCRNCALARTDPVLSNDALVHFYTHYFSKLHRESLNPTPNYIEYVKTASKEIFTCISNTIDISNLETVCEIGCASGINLIPFNESNITTSGFDYDRNYMEWGIKHGLDLKFGDYKEHIAPRSQDLIILSHVLEHLKDPIDELNEIYDRLNDGGYLYIEVPGILNIHGRWRLTPTRYFQNDHIYHYCETTLTKLVCRTKLTILYSDEWCRMIATKESGSHHEPNKTTNYQELADYIKHTFIKFRINRAIISVITALKLKNLIKKILKRA